MEAKNYDLVVLGSGPAGEKGAAQAAYFGKRVALVEREGVVGGASCNTGTLSSKTLRESALALSSFRSRNLFGVDLAVRRGATVQDFLAHERAVTSAEREAIEANLRRHGVDVYRGSGSFGDAHTITVTSPDADLQLRAEVILIATGSKPLRPPLFRFEDERVWDSDEIVNLTFMPGRMAVIGGGVIGCEYACTFAALGVDVSLVDGRTELLEFLDRDIWGTLEESMSRLGVRFVTGERVAACDCDTGGAIKVSLASGREIEADAVLVAAGRQANTDDLNLSAAGITSDERGRIQVNENYQTAVSHIYAAGDVVGFPALASTSMEQARLAMVHAFDLKYKKSAARVLPLGIFTIPEVSAAGETESSLQEKGIPYVAGRAYYNENARGKMIGDTSGVLKLLFAADDMRLLGLSVVGEGATELVHVGLVALMAEADSSLFIETCFNYPTLGQLYKYATYDAMGVRRRDDAGQPPSVLP